MGFAQRGEGPATVPLKDQKRKRSQPNHDAPASAGGEGPPMGFAQRGEGPATVPLQDLDRRNEAAFERGERRLPGRQRQAHRLVELDRDHPKCRGGQLVSIGPEHGRDVRVADLLERFVGLGVDQLAVVTQPHGPKAAVLGEFLDEFVDAGLEGGELHAGNVARRASPSKKTKNRAKC